VSDDRIVTMWPKNARLATEARRSRNKYGATRAALFPGGKMYPSGLERDRAAFLRLRQAGREISDLREQTVVLLADAVRYHTDFDYLERGRRVYEDAKGKETERFLVICQLWAVWGPGPLRIVKGARRRKNRDRGWVTRVILPKGRPTEA